MIYEIITTPTGEEVLTGTDSDGKVWFIPQDETNTMYAEYLESLKVEPIVAPVEEPVVNTDVAE